MTTRGPRTGVRRGDSSAEHWHPEYWTETDHNRFEDRVSKEIHELRTEVRNLGSKMTSLLAGLGVVIFIVNIVATWVIRTAV